MARHLSHVNETKERSQSAPTTRLSEENLRRHNVEFQQLDNCFQADQAREERIQAAESESYCQIFGDMEDLDMESDFHESENALRRKASLDVLKLYSGALVSLTTPMCHFMDTDAAHTGHLRKTKNAMEESGMAVGEAETFELRTLVSDMVDTHTGGLQSDIWDAARSLSGSPRPDSDTLSNPDISELMPEVKKTTYGRNQKRTGMVKRSRMDRMNIPRSIPASAKG